MVNHDDKRSVTVKTDNQVDYLAHKRSTDGKEQSVEEHQQDTAALSKKNAEKIALGLAGELGGLLHDLGKYGSSFQAYIKAAFGLIDPDSGTVIDSKNKRGEVDHSSAGAQYLWNLADTTDPVAVYLAQMIALCIASHHSGLIDCLTPTGEERFFRRMEKSTEKTHLDEVADKCDSEIRNRIDKLMNSPEIIQEFVAVMKQVCSAPSETVQQFRIGFLVRFLFSCLIDADRTDTADFTNPDDARLRLNSNYPGWEEFIHCLDRRLAGFTIRNRVDEIRQSVSSACKTAGKKERGIYSLTVPTGGGKTLASLRFALEHSKKHRLKRIVFVIPYTSIIDQNASEVRKVFSDLAYTHNTELVLEHHSNLTPDKDTLQSKILAENWDAPIVYTTSVQLLESLFSGGTRGGRRMHQLAESVIVFDEIQTLPIRMVHLFNNAINFMVDICRSSVVLCTATQPCLDRVDPVKGVIKISKDHEIIPDVEVLFDELRRVEVIDAIKPGGWRTEEVAGLVMEELKESSSVLIVVNTKRAARELFQLLSQNEMDAYHLSTDMCPAHRMGVLTRLKQSLDPGKSEPVICVSTQLIEAGVDIDFDCVIRYVAGLDSIAQAAGRCNRNGIREKGRVIIVNPAKEATGRLKDIEVARDVANRVLDEFRNDPKSFGDDILSPKAMARYFDYYFFDRASEMDYPVSAKVIGHSDTLLRMLSTNEIALQNYGRDKKKAPGIPLRQSFQSAGKAFRVIDSETQGIIVPYGRGSEIIGELCASSDIFQESDLIKEAQRYSVNCFKNMIDKLGIGESGALYELQGSGILCLKPEYYSENYGVSVEPVAKKLTTGLIC
jgi:CRISPR-associated endonuclease/helicase Cas3